MSRLVVGAVALLLALTGCGGDPKPDPSPSASTPLTSPASTTPAPPVMPEEAKADTKAGAIAFVKYYIDLINHAQATGDVDSLAAVESVQCRSCVQARQTLSDIYAAGGHIEGGSLVGNIQSAGRRRDLRAWTVFDAVRFGPQDVVKPSGTTSLKGGQSIMTLVVRHKGGGWQVLQWSRAS